MLNRLVNARQIDTRTFPCGFCGRSGIASCSELYLTTGKSPQAVSGCQRAHKFQYALSIHSSTKMPSTNTPVLCPVPGCTRTQNRKQTAVWKYNLPEHIRQSHPGFSPDGIEDGAIASNLLQTIYITDDEEERLGIPVERRPHKVPPLPTSERESARSSSTVSPSSARSSRGMKRGHLALSMSPALKKHKQR